MRCERGRRERDGRGTGPGPGRVSRTALLEEELRQAAAVLDPVPAELVQTVLDAFVLHDWTPGSPS
ncbi:hypothetical protein GCM10017687_77650 [Streptomyces echinatus]